MKGWAKVALGILAVLLLICVGGGLWFFSSGAWDQVKGFTGETMKLKSNAEGLEKLQREMPFEAPEDGRVTEERLLPWLSVRERLQPKAQEFNAWTEAHQGKQGDFGDAREALGLLGGLMGETLAALKENGMGPAEYRFIERQMDKAALEAWQKRGGGPLAAEALAILERLADDPSLSEEKRAEVTAQAEALRAKVSSASEPLSPNAELYERFAERILASELGEFGDAMLQGGNHGRQHGGVRIETR